MEYLLLYLAAMSLAALLACYYDKRAAVRHKRRISEKTLLLLCALGSAYGFAVGMRAFRHKTRHTSFRILVPVFCVLWTAGLILICRILYFS